MSDPSILTLQLDHRSVPIEVLRDFVRSQAELTSLREIAEDSGVGRSTVHKFASAGTTPHPRVRRLLALWYLRLRSGMNDTELIRPYLSALTILVAEVPAATLQEAVAYILNGLEQAYVAGEESAPRWVGIVRLRVARDLWCLFSSRADRASPTIPNARPCCSLPPLHARRDRG